MTKVIERYSCDMSIDFRPGECPDYDSEDCPKTTPGAKCSIDIQYAKKLIELKYQLIEERYRHHAKNAAMTSAKDYADFSGSLECRGLESHLDWPQEPDMLYIFMTRGERRVRELASKAFPNIKRVVIDVDGEKHEYDAGALIALLEELEVRDG